ncbi:MAG: homoserine kinase [Kofleriaceae bacterium]
MALFTALDATELAEICELYGLGPPESSTAIAAGTINSNFALTAGGARYFLRVNEGKTTEDVAWEAQLVGWLAHHGFPSPAPVPAPHGAGYLCWRDKLLTLFPWVSGRHLAPGDLMAAHVGRVGQALGRLHRLGQLAPPSWRRRSRYDAGHLAERFAMLARQEDPVIVAAVATLRPTLVDLDAAAAARAAATETLIHGDLFRDNVLWDDARLVAVLDFEQASGGSAAYDLAVCFNDWCWDGAPRADLVSALLAGYQEERALTPEDRAALPVEVCAAAARFTLTRLTDVYLARVDNPEKDFRDFLARLEAWKSPVLHDFLAFV